MKRALVAAYGGICYLLFLPTFLYAVGFVGNFGVPKSIDSGVPAGLLPSLLVNALLLGLFGLQHSVMARQGFKKVWTRFVPEPMERSTYVLLTNLVLALLFWQWQPMPELVWSVSSEAGRIALWTLFGLGWGIVLLSSFLISHAHLFGLEQVHAYFKRRQPAEPDFKTPSLYRSMRHPMQTGFLIAFWATPDMSVGHLVFAISTTAYILVALQLEERDLIRAFGETYQAYRERVPMLLPALRKTRSG